MKRPTAIDRLLEELEGEVFRSDIETIKTSKLVICDDNGEEGYALSADELRLALANLDTTQRLIDAIDKPSRVNICLCEFQPNDSVLGLLERTFATVDEE